MSVWSVVYLQARVESLEKQVKLLMKERNESLEKTIANKIRKEKQDEYLDKLAAELNDPNV